MESQWRVYMEPEKPKFPQDYACLPVGTHGSVMIHYMLGKLTSSFSVNYTFPEGTGFEEARTTCLLPLRAAMVAALEELDTLLQVQGTNDVSSQHEDQ